MKTQRNKYNTVPRRLYKLLFVGYRGKLFTSFLVAKDERAAWELARNKQIGNPRQFADYRLPVSSNFEENILKLEEIAVLS